MRLPCGATWQVRHLKARAQRLAEQEDAEGEQRCLKLARALCDDSDHELLYDQACGELERGELQAAHALLAQADDIARGRDPRVRTNLAHVQEALGLDDPARTRDSDLAVA